MTSDRSLLRHVPLAAIVAAGALLRLWNLAHDPLYGDEAEYAIVGRSLSRDPLALDYPAIHGIEDRPFVSQPPLLLYAMALSMRLLGPTSFAAALPSALLGIATILLVHRLGARLSGPIGGIASAALIAFLPLHVELSRSPMLDVGYVFFAALALDLAWTWRSSGRLAHALGAGAAATLCALSKLPGALACLLVLALLLGAAFRARDDRALARRRLAHAAAASSVMLGGALAYVALLARVGALADLRAKLLWQSRRLAGDASETLPTGSNGLVYYVTDPHVGVFAVLGFSGVLLALAGLAFLATRRDDLRRGAPILVALSLFTLFFAMSGRRIGFYLLPSFVLAAPIVAYGASRVAAMRWSAGRGARAAGVVFVLLALTPAYGAAADAYATYGPGHDPRYPRMGDGMDEAMALLDEPGGAYGTLLGRFSLVWYTQRETFHWYDGPDRLARAVHEGEMRYVVIDDYLDLPREREQADRLLELRGARLLASLPEDAPRIHVYRLGDAP